jgi:hypothetical protein
MQKRSSGGCGSLPLLLFFVFLVLKLAGGIDWSWWWVTAPLWLPAALVVGGLILAAVLGVSVYKVVGTVLRKPGSGKTTQTPQAPTLQGEVIDVEGDEVP